MAYYWRDFSSEVMLGPETFMIADSKARELSRVNKSGLAEVVTRFNGILFPVATYLRGVLRYKGSASRDALRRNKPPRG